MVLPILGAIAKAVVPAVIGSAVGRSLDRKYDQKSREDQFQFYTDRGATLQEILGAGGINPAASPASTVLGNQMAELQRQKREQEYQQRERDKDRAIAMRGQDVSALNTQTAANASIASSGIAAGASRYSTDASERIASARLALDQNRFSQLELPQGLQNLVTSTPEWKRQELMARMGVDNALATAILGSKGIDVMDPNTLRNMSTSEFRQLVRDIYGYQSRVFGESAGAATIVREGAQEGVSDARSLWDRMFGGDEGPRLGN